MKKYIFMIITIFFIFFTTKKLKVEATFNELNYIDNYNSEYFYISSNNKMNTKNILDYFSDENIKIIGIYPNLDKIYDKKIKEKLNYYSFSLVKNKKNNLNNFINNYVSILKSNNYLEEANMIFFEGIDIDKILVYATYNSIYEHKNKYNNFIYKQQEF